MNTSLNKYIQYIKDNYETVNDYILKNSFNDFFLFYNVNELQQKNKEIITQNKEDKSETLQEHIPRDTLEEAGAEEQEGEGDEEPKGAEEVKKIKVKKKKK
jgi:hypothetical protein